MSDSTDDVDWYDGSLEMSDIFDSDEMTDYQPQKRKEQKMARETITVLSVSKKSREYNGRTVWSVKVREDGTKFGVWYSLSTENKPTKGETYVVDVEKTEGNDGRVFYNAEIVKGAGPSQPIQQPIDTPRQQTGPAQPFNGNRVMSYTQPLEAWKQVIREGFLMAAEQGVTDDAARVSLVAIFAIPFGDGKLALEPFGDGKLALEPFGDWSDVAPPTSSVNKHEKTAAHVHLEKTIWKYFERIDGSAVDAAAMLKEVSDKTDVLELSEKEAIAARLKAEKIIDDNTDYRTLFTAEAKKVAEKEKWNFAGTDDVTKEKKKMLLIKAGITKPFKDLSNLDLRAALEKLTDDVSH